MDISILRAELESLGCVIEPCGSRVTCSPPPIDTDEDYLVHIVGGREQAISDTVSTLSEHGFKWEGNVHYQDASRDDFMSWRNEDVNLIVTANHDFAERHRAATHVCTRLNLLHKSDRIALFQAVLYGNKWDGDSKPHKPAPAIAASADDLPW